MIKQVFFGLPLLILLLLQTAFAQPAHQMNAAEIELALKKLNVLGSALYLAAHPDDENTAVLAYLENEQLVRTAYLSLTRGDGGQNLIGSEKSEALGIIRTQELLAARRIDGAEQFFTRAIDFGYSKSPDESIAIWGHDRVLSDIVWVIRKFRPDVVITRFTPQLGGHGHHRASAMLALEAFRAAADPARFPRQLKFVTPWQPKRIVWNAWRTSSANLPSVNTGIFNPLLGKSYGEVAALSRSMHKSQGFGASARRGNNLQYFQTLAGDTAKNDLFEGIDLSWNRVENSSPVQKHLEAALRNYNPDNPSAILPDLLSAYSEMNRLSNNFWIKIKQKELRVLIRNCAGLWLTAGAQSLNTVPGGTIKVKFSALNRSGSLLTLQSVSLPFQHEKVVLNQSLSLNEVFTREKPVHIPTDAEFTQPYWLQTSPLKGTYQVSDQNLVGLPQNPHPPAVIFNFSIYGSDLAFEVPVSFRWTDPVEGEKIRSLEVLPPVTLNLPNKVFLFPNDSTRHITVQITAHSPVQNGRISLDLSPDWHSSPASVPFSFATGEEKLAVDFQITPPQKASTTTLTARATIGNKTYSKSLRRIEYSHIPTQTFLPPASAKMLRLNLKKKGRKIGYIMGSGDEIPPYLEQVGYLVYLLEDAQLQEENLTKYDAIIAGVRAYNTRPGLKDAQSRLLNYVKNGGTYIVQYNTNRRLILDSPGPYPFEISRARVTVEEAPVQFLRPGHQLLNFPNKITEKDFDGWVQERGLYFAGHWDSKYETVIASNDPGESPQAGGLLFTHFGKGIFIYTGISWFRQLPAGVPGAYRFFVNLISAGKIHE